jgi:hypothetical protein
MVRAIELYGLECSQIISCHILDTFKGRLLVIEARILNSVQGLVFAQVRHERVIGENDSTGRVDAEERRQGSFGLDRHQSWWKNCCLSFCLSIGWDGYRRS